MSSVDTGKYETDRCVAYEEVVREVTFCFSNTGDEIRTKIAPGMAEVLEEGVVRQVDDAVNAWRSNVPLELDTYVAKTYAIPSFLVRVDCTLNKKKELFVYEIEDAPAGAAMTSKASAVYKKLISAARSSWPDFRAFISPLKRFSDVAVWLGCADAEYLRGKGLVWNVIRPEEADAFASLIPRSVTPIRNEGDKTAIAKTFGHSIIGTGFEVLTMIDLSKRWVIKPIQGTRANSVIVWWVNDGVTKRPRDAIVNIQKLKRLLTADPERMWIAQPWCAPLPTSERFRILPDKLARGWYIMRIYCAYSIKEDRYLPIGGMANILSQKYGIIHGRPSAVFAPLELSHSDAKKTITLF